MPPHDAFAAAFFRVPPFRGRGFAVIGGRARLAALWLLPAAALADPRSEQARALLERLHAGGAPGVSAAVAIDGRWVFSGGVGVSDLESGTPQNGASVHNVGSISKVIATVAVMQLWERGLVDLDAEIQTYVPWFPRKPWPVTMREILTHTSGIGRLPKDASGPRAGLQLDHFGSLEESTRSWRDEPLLFEPGTRWHYSGAVNLLQGVVEKAGGEPFETYLRRHVWEPAGMSSTQFDVPTRIVPHRGRGYRRDPNTGRLENYPFEDLNFNYVGGGMISSDEDLCRFADALNRGRLLKPATLAEMYRRQLPAGIRLPDEEVASLKRHFPEQAGYRPGEVQALLWVTETDAAGRRCVGHTGGARGTSSWFVDYPERRLAVAVHANFDRLATDLKPAEALAALFWSEAVGK